MSQRQINQPIASWKAGQSVSGFALLARKERRQDRNGNDYLDLEMADSSGRISAKVWGDSPALNGDFELHQFVAFKGLVKNFRDRLQLSVDRCRQATDEDRKHGFDEALLIPSSPEDLDQLWARLKSIYPARVQDEHLAQLAAETLEHHGRELRVHPAAKSIHHAYRGGLLEHVVSMAELALQVGAHYPSLDTDLLLLGVLFHDLGKLDEIGAMPANDYTDAGQLVGHVVIGRDLLRQRCAEIEGFPEDKLLALEHMVLSHQGLLEYGSPVEPSTAEALVLHFIDNLDSKLAQLRDAARDASGFQYIRGLGRRVYLGAPSPDGENESADDAPDTAQTQLDL